MDDRETARDGRIPYRWGAFILVLLSLSCRVPDPPVLKNNSIGVIYDTKLEDELRSGRSIPLLEASLARYVDTLAESPAVTDWSDDGSHWDVFVATNRGWFETPGDRTAANRVLDEVQYGRCDVSLPRQRRGRPLTVSIAENENALASVTQAKTAEHEDARATVASQPLSEEDFLAGVTDQIQRSRQGDLLIFVHGFNVSFESAVAHTARLALDIPFNGAVVSYCWPTQGGVRQYKGDEPINFASIEPFTEFLRHLKSGVPGKTRIHIVVHSMGNRIVMQSLNQLEPPKEDKPFENVVLCAPDVGQSDFMEWAPGVVAQSRRVTLYANQSDSALIASKGVHGEKRAGDAWQPMVVKGIETIDCSRIDFSLMGHSYYSENTDVLGDLFMLLKEDLPASKRSHLDKQKLGKQIYWQFARTAPSINYTWHFDE